MLITVAGIRFSLDITITNILGFMVIEAAAQVTESEEQMSPWNCCVQPELHLDAFITLKKSFLFHLLNSNVPKSVFGVTCVYVIKRLLKCRICVCVHVWNDFLATVFIFFS